MLEQVVVALQNLERGTAIIARFRKQITRSVSQRERSEAQLLRCQRLGPMIDARWRDGRISSDEKTAQMEELASSKIDIEETISEINRTTLECHFDWKIFEKEHESRRSENIASWGKFCGQAFGAYMDAFDVETGTVNNFFGQQRP